MGSIKLEGHQKTVLSVMPKATDWVYPPSKSSFSFLFFFPVTVGVVVRRQKDSDGQEVLGCCWAEAIKTDINNMLRLVTSTNETRPISRSRLHGLYREFFPFGVDREGGKTKIQLRQRWNGGAQEE
jgi:hypothetical protein